MQVHLPNHRTPVHRIGSSLLWPVVLLHALDLDRFTTSTYFPCFIYVQSMMAISISHSAFSGARAFAAI